MSGQSTHGDTEAQSVAFGWQSHRGCGQGSEGPMASGHHVSTSCLSFPMQGETPGGRAWSWRGGNPGTALGGPRRVRAGQLWGCRRLWCLRPGVCARPAGQQGQEDVLGSAQLPPSLQRNVKRRGCNSSPAPDTPKAGSSTSCLTRVVVPPLSRWFRKFQRAEGSHKGGQRVLASWPT